MRVDETERLRMAVERLEEERDTARAEIEQIKSVLRMTNAVQDIAAATIDALSAHTWEQERAAVVAWLRAPLVGQSVFNAIDLCAAANRIELGEHWSKEGKG